MGKLGYIASMTLYGFGLFSLMISTLWLLHASTWTITNSVSNKQFHDLLKRHKKDEVHHNHRINPTTHKAKATHNICHRLSQPSWIMPVSMSYVLPCCTPHPWNPSALLHSWTFPSILQEESWIFFVSDGSSSGHQKIRCTQWSPRQTTPSA